MNATPMFPISTIKTKRKPKNTRGSEVNIINQARFGADLNLKMNYIPIGVRVVDLKTHTYALVFKIKPFFKTKPTVNSKRYAVSFF